MKFNQFCNNIILLLCFLSWGLLAYIWIMYKVLTTLTEPAIRSIGRAPSHISWIHSGVLHVGLLGIVDLQQLDLASWMLTLHLGLSWMASSHTTLRTEVHSRQETQQYIYSGSTPFMLLFLLNFMGGWFNHQSILFCVH